MAASLKQTETELQEKNKPKKKTPQKLNKTKTPEIGTDELFKIN